MRQVVLCEYIGMDRFQVHELSSIPKCAVVCMVDRLFLHRWSHHEMDEAAIYKSSTLVRFDLLWNAIQADESCAVRAIRFL